MGQWGLLAVFPLSIDFSACREKMRDDGFSAWVVDLWMGNHDVSYQFHFYFFTIISSNFYGTLRR